jgi:putative membrane protein
MTNQTVTTASATLPFRAAFNPLIRPYLVVTIGFTMIVSIIGIPLAIVWFLGAGNWWARHYFDRLECELTDRAIRFRKGILIQVEKTIPLENIQDVTFIEGPILKHFNLSTLKFETAGGGSSVNAQMDLTGIIDAQHFRNEILAARDRMKQHNQGHATKPQNDDVVAVLQRIEARLDEIAERMKAPR